MLIILAITLIISRHKIYISKNQCILKLNMREFQKKKKKNVLRNHATHVHQCPELTESLS